MAARDSVIGILTTACWSEGWIKYWSANWMPFEKHLEVKREQQQGKESRQTDSLEPTITLEVWNMREGHQ